MGNFFSKYKYHIYWSVFASLILIQFVLQYYGLIRYHYPVPPGDDCVNHFVLADKFLNGQSLIKTIISTSYPPFFHWLVAMLAKIFHLGIIQILLYLTPALPIAASIVLFFLTREIFNNRAALLTMFMYSLLAVSPYQLLGDGGYPNLLAASIFIPIIIILLSRSMKEDKKLLNGIGAAIFIILTLVTHHLSSIYLILILLISLPVFLCSNSKSLSKTRVILNGAIGAAVIFIFFYILLRTSLLNPIKQMILNVVEFSNQYPFLHFLQASEPGTVLGLKASALLIGLPVSFFGFLGLVYFTVKKSKTSRSSAIIMVMVWAVVLLLGSRISFLSNPDRLVRDAAIPLVILASGVLELIIFQTKPVVWRAVAIAIFAVLSLIPLSRRMDNSFKFNTMVRFTIEDKQAISRITKNDPTPAILSFSCDDWLNYLVPGNKSLVDNNGNNPIGNRLPFYDYIYAEVDATSWMPARCSAPNLSQFETNPLLEIEDSYKKNYSSVYIYKIRR